MSWFRSLTARWKNVSDSIFIAAYSNDLLSLEAPKDVIWPENGAWGHFVNIYDWDRLILNDRADNILSTRLDLCTGPLPCSISLLGSANAILQRVGNGSFACLGSLGCSAVNISRLRLVCSRNRDTYSSRSAPFEIEGAVLKLDDSFVLGCSSQADGGSVRAYGGATVLVRRLTWIM